MKRRQFLTASIAASALAIAGEGVDEAQPATVREYYQIRRYTLQRGPQPALTESYFAKTLIPALTRMGMGPVGAFTLTFGPETPTYYLVIPSHSVESLVNLDLKLAQDADFLETAVPFWNSTAKAPAFQRAEVSLLKAFAGWPNIKVPPASDTSPKRIFQLRTYESPSYADHIRKVEMFDKGAIKIFQDFGFQPIFFGDTLCGTRTPCLTYMLTFPGIEELDAGWNRLLAAPAWKNFSAEPRYAFDQIVTNITNLVIAPLPCSQV